MVYQIGGIAEIVNSFTLCRNHFALVSVGRISDVSLGSFEFDICFHVQLSQLDQN